MGTVLLYNITDPQKRVGVLLSLRRFGLRWREVRPEEQALPLGALLGLPGYEAASAGAAGDTVNTASAANAADGRFTDEMLVLHALSGAQFNGLLDALRRGHMPVALKAVVTEHNVAWSSARLHRELAAEHRAMQKR